MLKFILVFHVLTLAPDPARAHLKFRVTQRRTVTCASLFLATRVAGDPRELVRRLFAESAAHWRDAVEPRDRAVAARAAAVAEAFSGKNDASVVASASRHGAIEFRQFFAHVTEAVEMYHESAVELHRGHPPGTTDRFLRSYLEYKYGVTSFLLAGASAAVMGHTLVRLAADLHATGPAPHLVDHLRLFGLLAVTGVGENALRLGASIDHSVEDLTAVAVAFANGDDDRAYWSRDFKFSSAYVEDMRASPAFWRAGFGISNTAEVAAGLPRVFSSKKRDRRVSIDVLFRRVDGEPRMYVAVRTAPAPGFFRSGLKTWLERRRTPSASAAFAR